MFAEKTSRTTKCTTRVQAVGILAALIFALTPAVAAAGQVYGQITENNRPVSKAGPITLKCDGVTSNEAYTDRYGAYKVYLRKSGRCQIIFVFGGKPLTHPVQSYSNPVRFNFRMR